jgi:AbrB family looped-hinge helix DNA binding protein
MQTKLSSKGQVVLPSPLRRKLGIEAGDSLSAKIEGESIVLTPKRKAKKKYTIKISKITGMPVIHMPPGTPKITNEMVAEMLADFP